MRRLETRLEGPVLLEPDVHGDTRGFFLETARANELAELGITDTFVQDNHSRSARGRIFDMVVDIRPESPAFGRWEGLELDDETHRQLYCPDGFAHGFCVLSDVADVIYRCSAYYEPEREGGFRYDDPDVGIRWPELEFTISERDRQAPALSELGRSAPQQAAH